MVCRRWWRLKISSTVVGNLYLRAKNGSSDRSMRRGSSLKKALEESRVGSGFPNSYGG